MNQVNTFIDKLFEKAKAAGLTDYEAYYTDGNSFRVMVFQGEVNDYNVNASTGLSFRAMVDGKLGYSYTEVLDDAAIDMLVHKAIENAGIIESEDPQFIFEGSDCYQDVNVYNPALDQVNAKDKIELALQLEKKCLEKDERIQSVGYCLVQSSSGEVAMRNSKGLDLQKQSNSIVAFVSPVAHKGEKMVDGNAIVAARSIDDIHVDDMVEEAVEKAISMMDAAPVPSGHYDIVFNHEAAGDLLSTFESIFSAESAQKDLSLLKGKIGETIASEIVTIVDDPLMENGLASGGFDSEGVATYTKNVVDKGVLTTLLHNLKTAAKDGVETTGNASKGSYNSPVGVSPFNFYIQPTDTPQSELLKAAEGGLLITDLAGLHTVSAVSADFSLSAKGYTIKDGKKDKAVEQITVAGNYYELLKNIQMIANDLKFDASSTACPSILVKGITIAGE